MKLLFHSVGDQAISIDRRAIGPFKSIECVSPSSWVGLTDVKSKGASVLLKNVSDLCHSDETYAQLSINLDNCRIAPYNLECMLFGDA